VAYNDAVQVVVLISGSALLTIYGLYCPVKIFQTTILAR